MWGILLLMMVLVVPAAVAQISGTVPMATTPTPMPPVSFGGFQQPFTTNIESEALAPAAVTPSEVPPAATGASAVGAAVGTAAAVAPVSAFVVKGVSVTLGQTTGFARDAALDMAARKALPQVLVALPLDAAQAEAKAKAVGNPMNFVSSYVIVKEVLVPTYGLTVDLTFNEPMLRANFGGVKAAAAVVPTGAGLVSGTVAEAATPTVPLKMNRFVVRVPTTDPVSQDKVYRALSGLENTQAHYRIMAGAGAEFGVTTPLDEGRVDSAVRGMGGVVMAAGPEETVVSPSEALSGTAVPGGQ